MEEDKRYYAIETALRKRGFILSACHPALATTMVEAFEVWIHPKKGHIRIIEIFNDGDGYEVFRPVAEGSNKIQDTLDNI